MATTAAPSPQGSYSQAVDLGQLVVVSGQGPFDPETGRVVGQDVGEQTEHTLRNVAAILNAAGLAMKDVVKVSAFLESFELFDDYDSVYRAHFPNQVLPARTTVACQLGGILVEIDAIAVRSP